MTHKRPFLLANARRISNSVDITAHYDEIEQVNVAYADGKPHPLVSGPSAAWTSSKTESAPGDDDPDPEAAGCY